ncbi:hypothetical protein [Streptomyces catenulae]|uniref:Secreted protein n=1 Tax=Streptomyces catenulae TaxID=66875 RepID=A0ABV2Z2U7_9ACTN|nr:hypothetical protein [Streptomyces catenulae]
MSLTGPARCRRPYARRAGLTAALCLVATVAAAAPPAPAAPVGCGGPTGGVLCLRGPVGRPGVYTAHYRRGRAGAPGEIAVRLGYQRKDSRITAFPGWFGTVRTTRGAATLRGRVGMEAGECIRGVMEHGERVYVTKWSCG